MCSFVLPQGRTKEVEPWYSTDYSQEPVPNEWLSSWLKAVPNPAIHLPKPNPFISSAFGLINVRMLPMTSPTLCYVYRPGTYLCSTCYCITAGITDHQLAAFSD